MYFEEAGRRLLALARGVISRGGISERGLARESGISQPHLHNALKNMRTLSVGAADRLMKALNVTIADLLWSDSTESGMKFRLVPMLRHKIGPGIAEDLSTYRGGMPLPESLVEDVADPVVARLAPDLGLPKELAANDIVLLDKNPVIKPNSTDGLFVISSEGGLFARCLRPPLGQWSRRILEKIKARIAWIGRRVS